MNPGPTQRSPDTIHRPFFLSGIGVVLTLGAGWGVWLLWRIAVSGTFTGVSVHAVNAHGLAQIYGWVGLFILGFAYQFFPRMAHVPLSAPRLAPVVLAVQLGGIVLASAGLDLAGAWTGARALALAGGTLLIVAASAFAVQIGATLRRASFEPWIGFAFAAIGWFLLSTLASAGHAWLTMGARDKDALVWAVGTYQAPLRDLQIHGMALFMILGVSLKLLPSLLGVPRVPDRRAWGALAILLASVAAETVIFLVYRFTGRHWIAALLMLPWTGLTVGAAMIAGSMRLWSRYSDPDRTGKFVRAAYTWLFVSLAMLLLLPIYQVISHLAFSHAWYGATRHAVTVGFISMMIMGMSARFVPALARLDRRALPRLWGPFVLVNVGCFLRVVLQVGTDWSPAFYDVVGFSGVFEIVGLTWWGAGLAAIMLRRRRTAAYAEPLAPRPLGLDAPLKAAPPQ